MKAFTLHQPWATLIAIGAKSIETRSWPTKYRGRLLIHAGLKRPKLGERYGPYSLGWHRLQFPDRLDEGFTLADTRGRVHPDGMTEYTTWPLPLGAVVASCELVDVVPVLSGDDADEADMADLPYPRIESRVGEGEFPDGWLDLWHPTLGSGVDPEHVGRSVPEEAHFGDFTPGRWAWLLEDVQSTIARCPRCWGKGEVPPGREWRCGCGPGVRHVTDCGRRPPTVVTCPLCFGLICDRPVPMRGKQGLWAPDWEQAA